MNAAEESIWQFLIFILLFAQFVPISLYVTIDVVKFVQSLIIAYDLGLYHEEILGSQRHKDCNQRVRTNEEGELLEGESPTALSRSLAGNEAGLLVSLLLQEKIPSWSFICENFWIHDRQ